MLVGGRRLQCLSCRRYNLRERERRERTESGGRGERRDSERERKRKRERERESFSLAADTNCKPTKDSNSQIACQLKTVIHNACQPKTVSHPNESGTGRLILQLEGPASSSSPATDAAAAARTPHHPPAAIPRRGAAVAASFPDASARIHIRIRALGAGAVARHLAAPVVLVSISLGAPGARHLASPLSCRRCAAYEASSASSASSAGPSAAEEGEALAPPVTGRDRR